ncbi:MAG: hypothetical protein GY772_06930 [bacterium]|nr:hypothetical protein [bacterium]
MRSRGAVRGNVDVPPPHASLRGGHPGNGPPDPFVRGARAILLLSALLALVGGALMAAPGPADRKVQTLAHPSLPAVLPPLSAASHREEAPPAPHYCAH